MTNPPRYAIILVLSLGAGFLFNVYPQAKTAATVPRGSVSGRITIHDKGAPGIIVAIRTVNYSPQPAPLLKATTDQDGNYRIVGVPAGNYQVWPLAPVYVMQAQALSRNRGRSLLVAEGENVEGVDFSLERGGVITGKVTDADGRPVIEEHLTIVPADQASERRQMVPSVGAYAFETDDRGIYRAYGIPEGRYKIFVGQADDPSSPSPNFGRVAYRRTFYPEASDPKDAGIVEVNEGTEARDIDIRVGRSLPGFAASGKVVDGETGQPVPGVRLGVRRVVNEGFSNDNTSVPSNSQGEFRVENVTPGKYGVWILPVPGTETRAEAVPFEVIDQDVTGLLVKTFKGLSVSGVMTVEGTNDKSLLPKIAELRLFGYVRDNKAISSYGQGAVINPDGSFRVSGLGPGTINFSVSSRDGSQSVNFSILRVERDGVVQPRGFEIKVGDQVSGVKIVLAYGTGSIQGEVKLENGPLPEGGRVVLFVRKMAGGESNIRSYEVDSRGHFLIGGLAAGEYNLRAQANLPGRRSLATADQQITVTDGTVTEVSVSLDLKTNPGQAPGP